MRLCDAAGLAVATARFALHKETVHRLVSQMCGSRFGRGVVVPGGVAALPRLGAADLLAELARLDRAISGDVSALMGTSSFLDRLRRTGPCGRSGPASMARSARSAGPRATTTTTAAPAPTTATPHWACRSGCRMTRVMPWPGSRSGGTRYPERSGCSAGRRRNWPAVTWPLGSGRCRRGPARDCAVTDGRAVGWAEAPQGEVLYDLRIEDGRITRCRPRSASFHNLVLFHEVFAGDILTDFPFIEASSAFPSRGWRCESIWVLRGLRDGVITTRWPARADP